MKLLDCNIYKEDLNKVLQNIELSCLKNKSIIVTGGLGLIGSAIVDLLVESNVSKFIYVLGRNEQKYNERYGNLSNVHFVKYDALKSVNLNIEPDFVIYAAGLASPDLYVKQPVETMLSNFMGLQGLLAYCKNKSVEKFIYISSSEVYGNVEKCESLKENNYGIINIDDIRLSYAEAKRASELLCRSYFSEYGIKTIIVRPGHIYGPSASSDDRRISAEFAYKAACRENLVMKSSGLQKRSYCYSLDCARAILRLMISGVAGEAYNIGHSEKITIREMAKILADAGGVKLLAKKPTDEELKAFNPMNNATLDDAKIRSLGHNDIFSVKEGLNHTVEILRETSAFKYIN